MENTNYVYKLISTIATTSWYEQIVLETYTYFSDDTLTLFKEVGVSGLKTNFWRFSLIEASIVFHRFCFPSALLSSDVLCQNINYTKSGIIRRKYVKLWNTMFN